jgi:monoamine oxidase
VPKSAAFLIFIKIMTFPIIIIGAGLSGLTAAHLLKKENVKFLILEARERIGGRIFTEKTTTHDNIEMGATWFGFKHEHLRKLLDELKIGYFQQYNEGESTLVFNSMSPPHHFRADNSAPPSYRIANGSKALIEKLAACLEEEIKTEITVTGLIDRDDHIEITTAKGIFKANKVILTMPPRLAEENINFHPPLDADLQTAMHTTPTWMEDAIKFGLTFKSPFWRESGKSGMVISQIAPVLEVYDHNNYDSDQFALVGFINPKLRSYEFAERKEQVISYLTDYLGVEVGNYLKYIEKDWSLDLNTAVEKNKVNMQPFYGNPIFKKPTMNGKLFCAGTETSPHYGGYMEGAVFSGFQTAQFLI